MSILEIVGCVVFCIFIAGWVGLLITSCMMLFASKSKILNFFFILSAAAFCIAGFSITIISSFTSL